MRQCIKNKSANDYNSIEILRDLHDETGVPIILIGMQLSKHKLKKHTHLIDRISEIYNFTEFEYSDIKQITDEISEAEITKEAVKLIFDKAKSFRKIVQIIDMFEKAVQANGLSQIDKKLHGRY